MMSRSCRYYAALLLLLGMSCAWAAGAPDPRTTVLPIYQLPASAAVDGKLGEWAHVPVSDDQLIYCAEKNAALVAPSENIAVSLRCGRVAGKPDLYFLIVVKDSILLSREAHYWVEPDYLELYFDLFREKRTAEDPEWRLRKFFKPPAMGQFGLRPLCMNATPTLVANNVARPWKLDYACVPIEGGVAYEIRLDGQSVLANLKDDLHAADLPPVIGFDIGVGDLDSPVILRAATWNNLEIFYRFFGDFLNHDTPVHYGGLSTKPLPVPRGKAVPIKTLEQLYGAKPTARQVVKCINTLPDAQLADLVRWAVIQGVPLNADLLTPLFAAPMPRAQEAALLALYYHREQADAVRSCVFAVLLVLVYDIMLRRRQ